MSNSTSTPPDLTTPTPAPSPSIFASSPTPERSSPSIPPTDSSTPTASTSERFSSPIPPPIPSPTPITTTSSFAPTSPSIATTSPQALATPSRGPPTSTSEPPLQAPPVIVSVITRTPTAPGQQISTLLVTSTVLPARGPSRTASSTTSSSTSNTAGLQDGGTGSGSGGGGLRGGGLIAVAVVVPIVAVALLVLASLFFWRKRKARKDAEELRRKEVEEYGYNPNNDPTLPPVGGITGGNDGSYEMREDGSSGYRGWGTTAVASSGRKASTTLSGPSAGGIGMAYSDTTQTPGGAVSDTRSDNNLVDGRSLSPEGAEALGAMGPAASQNRGGEINRGPSNASSSYSAANRSDGSGEVPGYGGAGYNNQYESGNPYSEGTYGSPPGRAEVSGQPVIRDVSARRNTRIENPSHFPQQSSGISQNF